MVLVASPLAKERVGRSRCDVKPLPFHEFEITSPLKRQDAVAALNAHLEPAQFFRVRWPNSANEKRFQGAADDNGFKIQRVLGYNNVFAPVSTGVVQGAGAGSQIVVKMQPHVGALALFGGLLALGTFGMVLAGGELWMPLVLVAMLYVMVMFGFWFEAGKQERTLREIFRAL